MQIRAAAVALTAAWLLACGGFDPLGIEEEAFRRAEAELKAREEAAVKAKAEAEAMMANSFGGPPTSPCGRACTNLSNCGIQPYDSCVLECPAISEVHLNQHAQASCADLQALAAKVGIAVIEPGTTCIREGTDDCPGTTMCCYDGREARPSEPGACLEPGTCFMPK